MPAERSLANTWNRLRYGVWSVGYDLVVRFAAPRRRAVELLRLQPGEQVLIVGAGTGADLPFLPPEVEVVATDLSAAMLARARPKAGANVELRVMDAQALDLPDESFDAVLLHLLLAIVPDPVACLGEAVRVLRAGGRISVFDKFVAAGRRPSLARRLANLPARFLATDLNRVLEDIVAVAGVPLAVEHDEWTGPGRLFRLALLRKRPPEPHRQR